MTSINVSQRTQMIVVDVASRSVSIINAGPVGPAGPMGEVSTSQLNTALDLKVAKAGDTMTGALTIPVTPTAVGHATSKQYVDTAISNAVTALLDGTPGALDTLNELAAALGDDANFAASVTTALAGKQPLDSDLTALAGLATTAWGRQVLTLADSAAALTYLGAAPAADLTSHVALKNAHGVTRELVTFTAATPVHIPGNLLSHDQQRGISGCFNSGPAWPVTLNQPGGADGGGCVISTHASGALARIFVTPAPVVAGTQYTLSARINSPATGTADCLLEWLDAGGAGVGPLVYGSSVATAPGVEKTCFVTSPAPAGATQVRCYLTAYGLAPDHVVRYSVLCLRTSPTIPASVGASVPRYSIVPTGSSCFRVASDGALVITNAGVGSWQGAWFTFQATPTSPVIKWFFEMDRIGGISSSAAEFSAYNGTRYITPTVTTNPLTYQSSGGITFMINAGAGSLFRVVDGGNINGDVLRVRALEERVSL